MILYTTGCPNCETLKTKLDNKGVIYEVVEDIEVMKDKGIRTVPILEVEGEMLSYLKAVQKINKIGEDI